jgi:hypothetical protein
LRIPHLKHRGSLAAILIGVLTLACGPIVMIPGGELSGEETAPPSDWSFTNEVETLQLETRPEDPYSVNVWGVAAGDRMFVAGAEAESGWVKNVLQDPRVRLRVGERLYPLQAIRTDAPEDLEAFLAAAQKKYDFEPEPEQRDQAVLFRLEPR